ncbi:MAG: LytTR family DNA-binding domain-containing protein [Pseudomonadota bacterium]
MTITALIADDEAPLRSYLKRQLATLWPNLEICTEASNGLQALELITIKTPDIAFLDIKMPGMTGIEVAAQLNGACHIVFITAYDQYAIQAFENAAIDYLLKPVTQERLQKTIMRLQQQLDNKPSVDYQALQRQTTEPHLQWIKVAYQDEIYILPINEIDYFQAANKYTTVVTAEKQWLIKTAIKTLETSLNPNEFWRIHRGTIVRVSAIARVNKDFQGRFLLKLHEHQETLIVSRAYAYRFKQM